MKFLISRELTQGKYFGFHSTIFRSRAERATQWDRVEEQRLPTVIQVQCYHGGVSILTLRIEYSLDLRKTNIKANKNSITRWYCLGPEKLSKFILVWTGQTWKSTFLHSTSRTKKQVPQCWGAAPFQRPWRIGRAPMSGSSECSGVNT